MQKKRESAKEFTDNKYNPFTAKNAKQKTLFQQLDQSTITFAYGAAGTGKTACVVSKACEALKSGKVDNVVISRPAVEAGESLGALPGELYEKFEPWMAPIREIMNEILGKSYVNSLVKADRIYSVPLGYMRGRTFNKSFMILDEAQNTTINQMKMFLTRIGYQSIIGITGDSSQSDIRGRNGLEDAISRLSWMPGVGMVKFDRNDVVRNSIISDILSSYDD